MHKRVYQNVRLVADTYGDLYGSFFFRDPLTTPPPPLRFRTGTSAFKLTSSPENAEPLPGSLLISSGETSYQTEGRVDTFTTTVVQTVRRRRRWFDPLAQSFDVGNPNGVFITSCDLYFSTKDEELPCSVEIRTCELGTPTTTIIPLSKKELLPADINVSTDASVATKFTFDSPIYLEGGKEYALVVVSPSTEYNIWISRLGEEDVSTSGLGESQKVLITQQPYLGSLFKSQNASTWTPSQLEDMKFTLYKAEFTAGTTGTVNFFNPELGVGNNEIVELNPKPNYHII